MIAANFLAAAALFGNYALPSNFSVVLLAHITMMFCFGIMITSLFAMYTDCSEYGEWKSGKNSAGLTVSASMFSLKFGSAMGVAIPSTVLALFGFLSPVSGVDQVQTAAALDGIRIMFNIVPGLFFLLAGILLYFYRIDRRLLAVIEQELRDRRAAAEAI